MKRSDIILVEFTTFDHLKTNDVLVNTEGQKAKVLGKIGIMVALSEWDVFDKMGEWVAFPDLLTRRLLIEAPKRKWRPRVGETVFFPVIGAVKDPIATFVWREEVGDLAKLEAGICRGTYTQAMHLRDKVVDFLVELNNK